MLHPCPVPGFSVRTPFHVRPADLPCQSEEILCEEDRTRERLPDLANDLRGFDRRIEVSKEQASASGLCSKLPCRAGRKMYRVRYRIG